MCHRPGRRSALVFEAEFNRKNVGDLSTEMIKHFFQSFAENIKANIHVEVPYGSNTHHKIEAMFKALARALRVACEKDARVRGAVNKRKVVRQLKLRINNYELFDFQ